MSSRNEKKKMNKALKVILIIIAVILALAIIAGIVMFIMYRSGRNSLKPDAEVIEITPPEEVEKEVQVEQDGLSVYYKGEKYKFNENAVPILLLGVDKYSFENTEGIGYNGQADAVYLAVLDTETNGVSILAVSRDSMVDVNMYSYEGNFLRTEKMQLCLSYAYGDGKEKSCENVMTSVSRLLCNIPLNSYIAIDFDSLPVLTEAVGGVTVPEYTDDGMQKTGNMITLDGERTERYLRWRWTPELTSNNARIERHKNYISAFAKRAVALTKEDITFPIGLYNSVSEYMVTNVGVSQITYLAANYLEGVENMQMYSIPGTIAEVDSHAQFTPDATALYETMLELFYVKQ